MSSNSWVVGRIAVFVGTLIAVAALVVPAAEAAGAPSTDTRYSIANGCFAFQPASGGFIQQAGGGFDSGAGGVEGAEGFTMRATDLGRFLLYTQNERFVAVDDDTLGLGDGATVAAQPSNKVDFTVTKEGDAFRFVNTFTERELAVDGNGKLVGVSPGSAGASGLFGLVEASGCSDYPEIPTNVEGEPTRGETDYGEVLGTVDAHMHLMAYEFLGGRAHCGKPWDRFGPAYALVDCPDHAAGVAPLETATGGSTSHDTDGWPTFAGWPRPRQLTHEGSYYTWLERAYLSGLRLYTSLMAENRVLCELYPLKKNSCNEFDSVKLQVKRMYQLQDYIDAQEGGPGKGWFRIVRNPFQAREVINDGKLAVIIGMEVSEPFNCRLNKGQSTCDAEDVRAGMEEIWDLGIRQMELINKFDNSFSGVAGDAGETGTATNAGNFYATGEFWDMKTCENPENSDRDPTDLGDAAGHNDDDLIANGLRAFLPGGTVPAYPEGPLCNRKGLTDLGEILLEKAMKQGMVVDPDHMSVLGRSQFLAILEANDYSGVVASHSWSAEPSLPRVGALGGVITPYAGDSEGFAGDKWTDARAAHSGRQYYGLGYGADMNGLGGQGGPRGADVPNPVTYPFQGLDPNVTVNRATSGTKTWDINTDGVSHYGMYADWFEDLRMLKGDEIVEDLSRGAEAYLQMWERAQGVGKVRCPIWRGKFTANGFKKSGAKRKRSSSRNIPLGSDAEGVLGKAGQPLTRERQWRWCARSRKSLGARDRRMVAVFDGNGAEASSGLVASTIHRQPAGGIVKGTKIRDLRKRAGRSSKNVWVRGAGSKASFFYGTKGKRVKFLGVVDKAIAQKPAKLKAYIKRAGLRGGSSDPIDRSPSAPPD